MAHKSVDTNLELKKSCGKIPTSKQRFTLVISLLIGIIILLSIIIFLIIINIANNKLQDDNNKTDQKKFDINIDSHKLISRTEWGGRIPLYERPGKLPIKYVIISHTAGKFCETIINCSKQVVQIQSLHSSQGSPDIGYNFLIGGDENIYVARGWDHHNFHMNLDTIGISFIGNYIYNNLTPGMIEATQQLLKMGIDNGKLDKDYILVAHNQTYNTQSPGPNVYKQIKFWPHFSPEFLTDIPD